MNNSIHSQSTEPQNDKTYCATTWCENARWDSEHRHVGPHEGIADLPFVTATGNLEDQVRRDFGVLVPEVRAELVEQTEPSETMAGQTVSLSIVTGDCEVAAGCSLTLDEAALLRKHLAELLRYAGREVAL